MILVEGLYHLVVYFEGSLETFSDTPQGRQVLSDFAEDRGGTVTSSIIESAPGKGKGDGRGLGVRSKTGNNMYRRNPSHHYASGNATGMGSRIGIGFPSLDELPVLWHVFPENASTRTARLSCGTANGNGCSNKNNTK